MKSLFIAGNWKSNKTLSEAEQWLQNFSREAGSGFAGQLVLCVPYTLLGFMASKKLPFQIGAQNVSPFPDGAYTGEISARMLKEFVDWVIIGHSERRKYFGESDELLAKKVEQSKTAGLKVIYCVQDAQTAIPSGVDVVGYEPYFAIGTGNAETPENARAIIADIKAKSHAATVIYGGSVTAENVASFVKEPGIDGVLPGGASLDPDKFAHLISAALPST